MSLERLMQIAPPVGQRDGVQDLEARWLELESRLGLQLPSSYKSLASVYGAGTFGGWIILPDILLDTESYLRRIKKRYDLVLEGRTPRSAIQYPLYPSPGGFFAWADDDDSGQVGWLTSGHPDEWPIIVLDNVFSSEYPYGRLTVDEFLLGWLERRIESPSYYPEDIPLTEPPLFVHEE